MGTLGAKRSSEAGRFGAAGRRLRAVVLVALLASGLAMSIGLFLVLLVPYLIWEIRRGKAEGHTWFTWWKPAGHSDIGPDTGPTPTTRGGVDQGRGARF